MKPTKEQLADPKWWDDSSNGYDYIFYLERSDEYLFADDNGEGGNFKLIVGGAGWKLLAKRPEPEWVPEVNKECLFQFAGKDGFDIVTPIFTGKEHVVFIDSKGNERVEYISGNFRPTKTQREELIDIIEAEVEDDMGIVCIADAIMARFDLIEKDGE